MLKKWKFVLTGAGILAAAFLYLKSGSIPDLSGMQLLTENAEDLSPEPVLSAEAAQDSAEGTGEETEAAVSGFSDLQKQELRELLSEVLQEELTDEMEQWVAQALKTNLASMMETGQLPQAVANYQSVQSSLVNINTADAGELTRLPGIGEARAQAILAWRAEHGAFTSVDELAEISGISEKTIDRFRSQVTL